jgi:D-amino-acid oxidase
LVVSALRPFRVGGLRLEKDYFKGKTVYHNYGHGAWGLNLSYCTGLIQVNEFEKD